MACRDGGTTADMAFTLGSVACMGACSQAPVMRIGGTSHGNLSPDKTRGVIRALMADEAGAGDGGAAEGRDEGARAPAPAGDAADSENGGGES